MTRTDNLSEISKRVSWRKERVLLKKPYLYYSIAGLNAIVIAATLLSYYLTDVNVHFVGYAFEEKPKTKFHTVNTDDMNRLHWIQEVAEIARNTGGCHRTYGYGGGDYCPPLPPLKVYQVSLAVELLEMSEFNDPSFCKFCYQGIFEYNNKYYGMRIEMPEFSNYVFYGVTSSIVGTFLLALAYSKLGHKQR